MGTFRLPDILRHVILVGLLVGCAAPSMPAATMTPFATTTPFLPTSEPSPTQIPLPPFEPLLPSPASTFDWDYPQGAKAVLGLGSVQLAAISPDGSRIAVDIGDRRTIINTQTFQEIWSVPWEGSGVFWSNDGSKIQSVG